MDATPSLTPDQWQVWRLFLAAQAQLTREVESRLRRGQGLAQGEYGTLAAVYEAPERRLRIGEIADRLGWEKSRTSHLLSRMEGRGLIHRVEHPQDGRGIEVLLTGEGTRRLLKAVRQHADDLRDVFFGRLTAEDEAALTAILERLQVQQRSDVRGEDPRATD